MVTRPDSEREPTPDGYFRAAWAASDDPWDHANRWYEIRKYDLTVACLPQSRYRRAFEPACGAGVLTRRLAGRADAVLATEREPEAVRATQNRCADLANVEVSLLRIPEAWPPGIFDLVVVSEVLYYLARPDLLHTIALAWSCLETDGNLVLVHYRRDVPEHTWTGDEVHEMAEGALPDRPVVTHVEPDFRLDVYRR